MSNTTKIKVSEQPKKSKQHKSKNYLARTGKTLGILSVIFFWMVLIDLALAIPGLVLSSVGKNADNEIDRKKATTGKVLSIIGMILTIAGFICLVVVLPVVLATR